ncbi:uncharacterized protein [Euphorbia lathyris]|uniref:uncharacterized protein n=1 Tax=Euphorbia lathyris TaxID=212925 RepID=UPI003313274A
MAKSNKVKCKGDSQRHRATPYPSPSCASKSTKQCHSKKKRAKTSEKSDWEGVSCSVCLEFPHNAVLLLCSSYNKGCRPYMCATSRRFSNCLAQYKKAYTKAATNEETQQLNSSEGNSSIPVDAGEGNEKTEAVELLCPLCRGQVKGCTVVELARKHFNAKKRTCMQDNCSFTGTYKQLKKHVKANHPLARPRAVDPVLEEKWKKLECERERSDVISTIMSSTPGAVVLGDYVIEPGRHAMYNDFDYESDDSLDGGFYPLEPFNRDHRNGFFDLDPLDEDDYIGLPRAMATGSAALSGRRFHRLLLGRTRRRWRYRRGHRV